MTGRIKLGYIIIFLAIFSICSIFSTIVKSLAERDRARSELDNLNQFISTFLDHDKTKFDLKWGNYKNITDNIGSSLDPYTECVLFYSDYQYDYDDNYGSCGEHRKILITKMGWDIKDKWIILSKPFNENGAVVFFRTNPAGLNWDGDDFSMPIKIQHFNSSLLWSTCTALLVLFILFLYLKHREAIRSREYLEKENEIKSKQLHDTTSLATGMAIWGHRLVEQGTCRWVGELLLSASTLSALCTAPEKPMPIPTNPKQIAMTLVHGYFFGTGESFEDCIELGELSGETIHVSQTDLMKILKNLLENAHKCKTGGKVYFHAKKTDQGVEFLVKNQGEIPDIQKIFLEGYSGRGSTGKGMAIIHQSIKNCASKLEYNGESGHVTFKFTV